MSEADDREIAGRNVHTVFTLSDAMKHNPLIKGLTHMSNAQWIWMINQENREKIK